MDPAAIRHPLQEAESLLQRGELSIAFQREMIAKLEQAGHDVTAAKLCQTIRESAGKPGCRSEPTVQGAYGHAEQSANVTCRPI
jgi:hypothetical protein